MNKNRFKTAAVVLLVASSSIASAATSQEVGLVFRGNPAESILWQTANPDENGQMSVALIWPAAATRAVLTVTAGNVSSDYEIADATASSYALNLPTPTQANEEKVYEMTLRYYAETALLSTETARVAAVVGGASDALVPIADPGNARSWNKSVESAVLQIPSGATALTVDGTPVAAESYSAPGWYWWRAVSGGKHTVTYADAEGVVHTAVVKGKTGFVVLVK